MTLTRRMSHYMITYYLPSSLFVVVSWTSFLIPSEDIQGRMALLVTLFLVLVRNQSSLSLSVRVCVDFSLSQCTCGYFSLSVCACACVCGWVHGPTCCARNHILENWESHEHDSARSNNGICTYTYEYKGSWKKSSEVNLSASMFRLPNVNEIWPLSSSQLSSWWVRPSRVTSTWLTITSTWLESSTLAEVLDSSLLVLLRGEQHLPASGGECVQDVDVGVDLTKCCLRHHVHWRRCGRSTAVPRSICHRHGTTTAVRSAHVWELWVSSDSPSWPNQTWPFGDWLVTYWSWWLENVCFLSFFKRLIQTGRVRSARAHFLWFVRGFLGQLEQNSIDG